MAEQIKKAAQILAESRNVLIFSGSGVSEESGIPTFRGKGGLWEKYNPALFGNIPGILAVFLFDTNRFVNFVCDATRAFIDAEPNPAHIAIAELESMGKVGAVITQNIDGLHQAAGSSKIIELHGSIYRLRCIKCSRKVSVKRDDLISLVQALSEGKMKKRGLISAMRDFAGRCDCGGLRRPDIVFFGESLPKEELNEAFQLASSSDCLFVVGTSAVVYPAANIPVIAARSGVRVVEVNPVPSNISTYADVLVSEPAGSAFAAIVSELKKIL